MLEIPTLVISSRALTRGTYLGEELTNVPDDARHASLHRDIKIFTGILLQKHHYEEANWLWMAFGLPSACQFEVARQHLRRAAQLAREHHCGTVANWIERDVLTAGN